MHVIKNWTMHIKHWTVIILSVAPNLLINQGKIKSIQMIYGYGNNLNIVYYIMYKVKANFSNYKTIPLSFVLLAGNKNWLVFESLLKQLFHMHLIQYCFILSETFLTNHVDKLSLWWIIDRNRFELSYLWCKFHYLLIFILYIYFMRYFSQTIYFNSKNWICMCRNTNNGLNLKINCSWNFLWKQ